MRVAGERIKRTRLIQTARYVVAVDVEAVVPADAPDEPCYESETVQFLKQVREHADRGDEAWLTRHGQVYVAAQSSHPFSRSPDMADDTSNRGPADAARINVHEKWELDYWTKELGVTPQQLKDAVEKAGVMAADVRKHLTK